MDHKEIIEVKGAKVHNLRNINVNIPKNKLIVITGVSGSGKSSLAFNTIYAEGQRRYIESLSSYARQFLGKLEKPQVDSINGISPAISIEQKSISKNTRSTVGTVTEIYDYLKILFSRIGKTYSPISNQIVKKDQISDIIDFVSKNKDQTCYILTKITEKDSLQSLLKRGYSRLLIKNEIHKINDLIENNYILQNKESSIIIDRILIRDDIDLQNRLTESIETAFFEGDGSCIINLNKKNYFFSDKFELDGLKFEVPSIHLFSFNNPYGACRKCEGYGKIIELDSKKIIKNNTLSVYEGAVSCWSGQKLGKWKDRFIKNAIEYNFPIHKAYKELSLKELDLLWHGNSKCKGILTFFQKLDEKKHKIQNRVISSRYKSRKTCEECKGSRLRKDAFYVKINKHSIIDILNMRLSDSYKFFKKLKLNKLDNEIASDIILEIKTRLKYLIDVGLPYLTLSRQSSTLSGGETQRVNLTKSLGNSLVGSMYILDEPSIGLHSRDTKTLIQTLKKLRDLGNTVIVVEHDEAIMKEADEIIDLGPLAGINGGELVFQGNISKVKKSQHSLTAKYLSNKIEIKTPKHRRKWKHKISVKKINKYNIINLNVNVPLDCLTLITGVSGSGKSTMINEIINSGLEEKFEGLTSKERSYKSLTINTNNYNKVEYINQNPIGRSSRSNPITYIKAYDDIRKLYSNQEISKVRKYKNGFFSFNIPGGRCENCKGEGEITVEMQFMSDVHLQCEACKGKKFKDEVLDVKFAGKNIFDILNLSVDESILFFKKNNCQSIATKIKPLQDVGLGYIKLGQSSSSLSGGEAQRVKLASFLKKSQNQDKIIFIFDEPTTGLHFHDIKKLLISFESLINNGHSIICIEHNLDIIKCADWIIDLGPEGGDKGGKIVFEGTPENLLKCKNSITAKYLKEKIY